MLLKLGVWWTLLKGDRGEGPVSYVIIVVIMAGAAVAIATGIAAVANGWLGDLQKIDDTP